MYSNYNILIITLLTLLIILLITKISQILSTDENDDFFDEKYSTTIFILSIILISIGSLCFTNMKNNNHFIFNKSLNISGIILFIYISLFHWNDFDDYYKLTILSIAFFYIIYFVHNNQ